ncbi:MAG: hypothetical protein AAGG07_11135 [Planctomycetota bacterium]
MKMMFAGAAIAAFAVGTAQGAISISMPERQVMANGMLSDGMPLEDMKLFGTDGDFDQSAGVAMTGDGQLISALAAQDTSIGLFEASGEGLASATVSAFGEMADASATTRIGLVITSDEAFKIDLGYDLGALVTSGSTANSTLSLVDLSNEMEVFGASSGGGNDQLIMGAVSIDLAAGQYYFSIVAETSYDAGAAMSLASAASADFSFDLTIIPTPASAALMGLGLMAATRRGR